MTTISKFQERVAELYRLRNYRADLVTLALGLCEEAGEVGKAINTFYNDKYIPSPHNKSDTLEHELCDALVYLFSIANLANIDLDIEFSKKLDEDKE